MPRNATSEAPSRAAIEWAARQTLRMHHEPADDDRATGRCAQCSTTPETCRQLRWAVVVLDALGEVGSKKRPARSE